MNLEQAFILDTPEKISKVVNRLDYFTFSEKIKLGTSINTQCKKLNCKISCPKAHKSFINANYVHTYIEDEFMPEKIAKEIDVFFSNRSPHLGQVMRIFPFPRGTRIFCRQRGQA